MARCTRSLAIALALLLLPLTSVGAADPSDPWIDLHTIPGFELESVALSAHPETGDPIQVVAGRIGEIEVWFQIQFDVCETRRACSRRRIYPLLTDINLFAKHFAVWRILAPRLIVMDGVSRGREYKVSGENCAVALSSFEGARADRSPLILFSKACGIYLDAWRDYLGRAKQVVADEAIAGLSIPPGSAPSLLFEPLPSAAVSLDDLARAQPGQRPSVFDAWIDVFTVPNLVLERFGFVESGLRQVIEGRIGTGRVFFDIRRVLYQIQNQVCGACDERAYDDILPRPETYERVFDVGPASAVEMFRSQQTRVGVASFSVQDCIGSLAGIPLQKDGTYPLRIVVWACGEAKESILDYLKRFELSTLENNRRDVLSADVRLLTTR